MNFTGNISIEKCPKCSQNTFSKNSKKYALEKMCDNCGFFSVEYYECCNNQEPIKVIYTNKNETKSIRLQCANCGGKIGKSPVAKFKDLDNNKLQFFSELNETSRLKEINELKTYYNELIKTNQWRLSSSYIEYLTSDRWASLRIKILKRDNYKCKCGEEATQVHHLTYERREAELDQDLVSICRKCHRKEHGLND